MPKVVNLRKESYTVYIGRAGKGQSGYFGSPIKLNHTCPECGSTHRNNGSTLPCYEQYARKRIATDTEFKRCVRNLQDETLGCFCKPKPCHGDVLIKLCKELNETAMKTVSIIGTAGRRDDYSHLSRDLYFEMYSDLQRRLEALRQLLNVKELHAVSGGAAWADHLAVSAYLREEVQALTLYLPAEWDDTRFYDTGVRDWRTNPGGTSNYYHRLFSKKMGGSTLRALRVAILRGATVKVIPGFKNRNNKVSESDAIVAYTFGTKTTHGVMNSREAGLKDGGTADTWNKAKTTLRIHQNIFEL